MGRNHSGRGGSNTYSVGLFSGFSPGLGGALGAFGSPSGFGSGGVPTSSYGATTAVLTSAVHKARWSFLGRFVRERLATPSVCGRRRRTSYPRSCRRPPGQLGADLPHPLVSEAGIDARGHRNVDVTEQARSIGQAETILERIGGQRMAEVVTTDRLGSLRLSPARLPAFVLARRMFLRPGDSPRAVWKTSAPGAIRSKPKAPCRSR